MSRYSKVAILVWMAALVFGIAFWGPLILGLWVVLR